MGKQKQVTSWSHLLIIATGAIATCLGLVVMLGWHIHNQFLLQILPSALPMVYNTALMFSLSGLSVLALGQRQYKIVRWLAIAVGLIAVLTLFQYIFNVNLGIDELLIKDYTLSQIPTLNTPTPRQSLIEFDQPLPGRPAFYTALSFALIATALMLICLASKRRRTSVIAGLCGAVVVAISILSLVGYFTAVITVYGWKYSIGLAIHTALGLLVLGIAVITLALSTKWQQKLQRYPQQGLTMATQRSDFQPDEDYKQHLLDAKQTRGFLQQIRSLANPRNWTIQQKIFAGLSLAAVVLVATNIFSYWSFVNYKENYLVLNVHSRQLTEKIETIISQLKDAETGQRDYIIVGRESYLEPYNASIAKIRQQVQELKTLINNTPEQLAQINTLDSLVSQKLAELAEIINLRRTKGFEAAQAVVKTDRGTNIMDQIRQLSVQIKQVENELLKQRIEQSRDNISTQNLLSIGIVLTFCLFYWVYYILKLENSKRQQTEQALRQSEQRWRILSEALPIGVVLVDPHNASFVDFNDAAAINLGYTCEEFASLTIADIDVLQDRQEILRIMNTLSQQSEGVEFETQQRTKSGEIRDVLVRGKQLIFNNRALIYAVWLDITERIAAIKDREQALLNLQHSEQRYRSLLTATTQIIWTTNAQGEVIEDMPSWRLVTGQSAEDMKGWGWLSVIHPEDQELTSRLWTKAIQTKSLYEIEHRLRTLDGSYRDFSVRSVPVLDDLGKISAWIGTHTDITEKKQAEAQLQNSYSLLQTVIEGTPDAIFAKDFEGRFLLANSTTAAILGKPVEEILNKDDRDFLPEEMARIIRETDRQIMTTGETQVLEEVVPTNGELHTYLSAKSVWRDVEGNVVGLVGIARDITERKLAEQEIKALNEDLERRVLERTAELTAANQELEAFSYSVSHDLRAPLRGIDGFSQALMNRYSEQLDDKAKHYLNRIRAGTQRMGELIDDLLTLSRVTRTEMRRKDVDLSAIANEIITELQQLEPQRQVEVAIAPGLIVNGDAQLLRVVLENLFNNAWKFTSARIQTKIEFNAILQADAKYTYFVRDNGAGFDMAYSNKLFGAFQRLHSTNQFPGTGIGLATVQRIINRHGGKVWAIGAVEEGATFYFTL